jgi:hypothetical protein
MKSSSKIQQKTVFDILQEKVIQDIFDKTQKFANFKLVEDYHKLVALTEKKIAFLGRYFEEFEVPSKFNIEHFETYPNFVRIHVSFGGHIVMSLEKFEMDYKTYKQSIYDSGK